ncbi:MAG: hypothetical protein J1E98_10665 [Lachnospiraceae bacterium]|nr:hypothetical protein [Lachnospiraceae bacterium]
MAIINGREIDTNASPSAYGWVFQVGAGITLMLDNIKEFTSLKMEGASDDIEITVNNGKIYAQAKSVTQMGDQRSASHNLSASLKLLESDSKNGDAIKLIYITNIANPLSSNMSSAFQYEHVYDFSTLSEEDQNKITAQVGADFPTDKFQVYILNFFGEGDNKFKNVKEKISEFLREAIDDPSYNKRLLDSWFETFMVNCADKPDKEKEVNLSKKSIVLPVIILVIETPLGVEEFSKVCNYEDYYEIEQDFRDIINRQECDYEFVAGVLGDFLCKKNQQTDQGPYKYTYVKDEWTRYEPYFEFVKDIEKKEALIKFILLAIITKRSKIDKIREAAKL